MLVKVCGIRDVGSALSCADAGVDWVGLNFHPASPRAIDLDRATEIVAALEGRVKPVGLFVDRPVDEIVEVVDLVKLSVVQLHGSESPESVAQLVSQLPAGFPIVRAYRLFDRSSVDAMRRDRDRLHDLIILPYAILVDAHVPGQSGGTGQMIADDLLSLLPSIRHLILAGGLTPENVADRVARVRPWMVDVASGVESSPGVKDPARIAAFVQAARGEARP